MNRLLIILSLSCLLWLSSTSSSTAHPHVFIRFNIEFLTDAKGVTGVRMNWDLDPMFSHSLIESYDKNKNQVLEADEVKLLEKEAFSNLENYHYLTYIFLNDKPYRFYGAEQFSAQLIEEEIRYTFTLPLEKPVIATPKPQVLGVQVYDESSFIWMSFSGDVEIIKPKDSSISYQQETQKETIKNEYKGETVRRTTRLTIIKDTSL